METTLIVCALALHVAAIYDVVRNFRQRNNGIRAILAFLPPLLGPIIYFFTRSSVPAQRREFMHGKNFRN